MELIAGENDAGRRLDRILRKALPDHPLSLIHRLLRKKQVFKNGKPAKAQDRVEYGDKITIPSVKDNNGKKSCTKEIQKKTQLEILWEGLGLIAVNKPAGIAVHGQDSLEETVQSFLSDKLPPSISFKPGPLHRLDKPSSGIVVFSVGLEGARLFSLLMRERKIKKTYLAVVEGIINSEEVWQDELIRDHEKKKTFIKGREPLMNRGEHSKFAITKVTPLAVEDGNTLIKAEIATGRTHQIRAQAAAHGHPLLGDIKYNGKKETTKKKTSNFFLHAWKLEFLEYLIEAPIDKKHPFIVKFGYSVIE
ncbi:MAG: RluA family pseudouridine synthase [Treponema sp.]|nr:RluA family pseudouridine synthase [Treponema sp.]MCL2251554.1 RluA family pseudouridine synthase [Treponema sp.]